MLLGIWDLSSLTRVQLSPPTLKKKCGILTTGPPGKSPTTILFDSPTNDPFGRHRVCVSKYPHFTDKGWNHFALCYQSVPLRCAKARRFIFFFFFSAFSNCSRSGEPRRTEAGEGGGEASSEVCHQLILAPSPANCSSKMGVPKWARCSEGSHPRMAFCFRFVGKWLGDG